CSSRIPLLRSANTWPRSKTEPFSRFGRLLPSCSTQPVQPRSQEATLRRPKSLSAHSDSEVAKTLSPGHFRSPPSTNRRAAHWFGQKRLRIFCITNSRLQKTRWRSLTVHLARSLLTAAIPSDCHAHLLQAISSRAAKL